jgi:hypothetical protein
MNLTDAEKTEVTTFTQAIIDAALALEARVKRMGEKPAPWVPRFRVGDRVRIKQLDRLDTVAIAPTSQVYSEALYCLESFGHKYENQLEPAPIDPLADVKAAHARGETVQACYRDCLPNGWHDVECPNWKSSAAVWRIKPLPDPQRELVPLEASDVPPGSVIRFPQMTGWGMVTGVGVSGVTGPEGDERPWCDLMDDGGEILRPGQTEWSPCSKAAIRS